MEPLALCPDWSPSRIRAKLSNMIPFKKSEQSPKGLRVPLEELEVTYARSSGPGGQNVNKVNSKCVMKWNIVATSAISADVKKRFMAVFGNRINLEGFVVLSSDSFRDQKRNQQDCVEKLQEMLLRVAHPPKARKASKPTAGSKRRRKDAKSARGQTKQLRGKVRHSDS